MDDESLRTAAVRAFEIWVQSQEGPDNAAALIEKIDRTEEYVGLLATDWNRREISERVTTCDSCHGTGRDSCNVCGGAGTRTCPACKGEAKNYGLAADGSRRLLNCKTCRGKGRVDCTACRRGIAICGRCAGQQQVRKQFVTERSSRADTSEVPSSLARYFRWTGATPDPEVEIEATIVATIDKPRELSPEDLSNVPDSWLRDLTAHLQRPAHDEHIVRQRLRIATIQRVRIEYALGDAKGSVDILGKRMSVTATPDNPFSRRASTLRFVRRLLIALVIIALAVYFLRDTYYWSVASAIAAVFFATAAIGTYQALRARHFASHRAKQWSAAAVLALVLSIGAGAWAAPRLSHAEAAIRNKDFDTAQRELAVLGADPTVWNELQLARTRAATGYVAAIAAAEKIPQTAPQYAVARERVDRLVVQEARANAAEGRYAIAAEILRNLSDKMRDDSVAAIAQSTFVPLARQKIASKEWREASRFLQQARGLGVPDAVLTDVAKPMYDAAMQSTTLALATGDAQRRLQRSIDAEQMWVAWELAAGTHDTRQLITLRGSMARDVFYLESRAARRQS